MKRLAAVVVMLALPVAARAGFIVGNVGFTVFEDAQAWAAAHPNFTSIDLASAPALISATNYVRADLNIIGYGLSLGLLGSTPALFADVTQGVNVQIWMARPDVYSFAFFYTPLPGADNWASIVFNAGGAQLWDYQNFADPFFFGVTSGSPITNVQIHTPQGLATTAVAFSEFQQDQAETPEPGAGILLSVGLLAIGRRGFRS